jgi:Dolichyl-phosphate-mannose-protein mannosyltransferase
MVPFMKRSGPWLEWGALALILLLYGAYLRAQIVPAPLGYDAQAYGLGARLLADQGRYHQIPADPYVIVGAHWVENQRGACYPKYPPFYPALVAATMALAGPQAGPYVNPACALLALLGLYLLCRGLVDQRLALLGPLLLALNPVLTTWALEQVSHASSLCFVVWGFAAFVHAWRISAATGTRRRPWLLVAAGLLLGYAVGIRYTNLLLALPPALALALQTAPRPRRLRRLALYAGGLLIPCCVLAGYHWQAFGGPLTTAYAFSREQTAFAWAYFAQNASHYATGLVSTAVGPLVLLAGLELASTLRADWRRGLFYALWVLPLLLLYTAYWFGPPLAPGLYRAPELFSRFILPTVIPCIALALLFLQRAEQPEGGRGRVALVAALCLVQGLWGAARTHQVVTRRGLERREGQRLTELVRRTAPPGSVLFAEYLTGLRLSYYRDHTVYPDLLLRRHPLRQTIAQMQHVPVPGVPLRRPRRLQQLLLDVDWPTYLQRVRALITTPLAAGRQVYLVSRRKDFNKVRLHYRRLKLTVKAKRGAFVVARITVR